MMSGLVRVISNTSKHADDSRTTYLFTDLGSADPTRYGVTTRNPFLGRQGYLKEEYVARECRKGIGRGVAPFAWHCLQLQVLQVSVKLKQLTASDTHFLLPSPVTALAS
jgi:hypothetical protein